MEVSITKRIPTTCPNCGDNSTEYHFSDGKIVVICIGNCQKIIFKKENTTKIFV